MIYYPCSCSVYDSTSQNLVNFQLREFTFQKCLVNDLIHNFWTEDEFYTTLIETFSFWGLFCYKISLFLMSSQRDEQIEKSVSRMMTIIDLARNIRDRHNKPIKSPLRCASNLSLLLLCLYLCFWSFSLAHFHSICICIF